MEEYVCHYRTSENTLARAVYHVSSLPEAMASHNASLPDFSDRVVKWVGPTGITFLMHDSKLSL